MLKKRRKYKVLVLLLLCFSGVSLGVVSAETTIEFSENLLSADKDYSSWRNHTHFERIVDRKEGVDFSLKLAEETGSLSRSGIIIDPDGFNMRTGRYYLVEGYLLIDNIPVDKETLDYHFGYINSRNGFWHKASSSRLEHQYFNETTGYIREIYYVLNDAYSRYPIHMMSINDSDLVEEIINKEYQIRGLSIREIQNPDSFF